MRKPAAVVAVAALTGCISLAPDYERPASELPGAWGDKPGQSAASAGAEWWHIFSDAALDALVEEAFAHNADLELALARVEEARALAGVARAGRYPSLDAGYRASRTESSLRTSLAPPAGTPREADNYRATLEVSYELDLWGRLRDASAAARAELLATEAARDTVRMAVAADVAQGYFALRSLDEQIEAARRSLATRNETLALQKLRFDNGVISEYEYRQIEAEVSAARALLPSLENRRERQESALMVLLGRSPRAVYGGAAVAPRADAGGSMAPVVPAGLPSELLLRRPDLAESEQRLVAANARIGVARAGYFPSITLTGMRGSESASLGDLFTEPAGISQLAGAVVLPLWNAGRTGDLVDAAHARRQQALAQYRRAIQVAFREVRDAITAQVKAREQFDAQFQRVAALRESLRLARLRYANGIASQLDVLDAERNLLDAELGRSDALRAQRAAVADLFKALGGGWGT